MRQRTLQGKSDRQSDRAEHRDDAGGLDTEFCKDRDQHKSQNGVTHDVGKKGGQGVINAFGLCQSASRLVADPAGNEPANDQDREYADDF